MAKKKMKILCDLGVGGERGRVFYRKQCASAMTATDYKDSQKVIKKCRKNSLWTISSLQKQ